MENYCGFYCQNCQSEAHAAHISGLLRVQKADLACRHARELRETVDTLSSGYTARCRGDSQ